MDITLLEKLAKLADELDNHGSIKLADDISELITELAGTMNELSNRSKQEEADMEANLTICPKCEGEGGTDDQLFCPACRGKGFITLDVEAAANVNLVKNAFIKKRKGKWCVVSKKGKNMGCYGSRKGALKRLRQVEFFKHKK